MVEQGLIDEFLYFIEEAERRNFNYSEISLPIGKL